MIRSPIDMMVDAATGFDPKMIRESISLECLCGNRRTDYVCKKTDPKGAARIVTNVCPKCGVESDYVETYYDSVGQIIETRKH